MCSSNLTVGAGEKEVGKEKLSSRNPTLSLTVEFEAWAEPKILKVSELKSLIARFGTSKAVAYALGGISEAFIRQTVKF